MKAKMTTESLLALVSSVFDAWSVVLFQSPGEGKAADLVGWHSEDRNINRSARIAPGKGLVGWILRNKSPLLVDSIEENQAYLGYYHEDYDPDIRSFMGCPVPGGGALCIDSKDGKAFSADRQKLLQHFALLFPQVQQLASHTGHSREVNTYFTALEHMAELKSGYKGWQAYLDQVLQLLKEAGGFQYAAFASLPENSQVYTVEGEYPPLVNTGGQAAQAVSQGLAGWVLRNGEAVYNEGTGGITNMPLFGKISGFPDFAASICVPVRVNRSVVGVLCLAGLDPRLFSPELRSFTRMATDDMALLLENISLRFKLSRLVPKATLQKNGAVAFDPDSPKAAPRRKKDD